MTELYQSKVYLKEAEKMIETLKGKISQLETEKTALTQAMSSESKGILSNTQELLDKISTLELRLAEHEEEIGEVRSREKQLAQYSRQLDEELIRWRERFEGEVEHKVSIITKEMEKER